MITHPSPPLTERATHGTLTRPSRWHTWSLFAVRGVNLLFFVLVCLLVGFTLWQWAQG